MSGRSKGSKDGNGIVYLDVAFQGESGGRLALRSRNLSYYTAAGSERVVVAWSAIQGARPLLPTSASRLNYDYCGLKITNFENKSLSFHMKSRADMESVHADINRLINRKLQDQLSLASNLGGQGHVLSEISITGEYSIKTFGIFFSLSKVR